MSSKLKLASINIESHKHLENRVLPFLKQEKPDVVCLQEVFESDVPRIESALGFKGHFVPMANIVATNIHFSDALGVWGLYLGANRPIVDHGFEYYYQEGSVTKGGVSNFREEDPNSMWRAVQWASIEVAGKPGEGQTDQKSGQNSGQNQQYTFAHTHFTWSGKGQVSDLQRQKFPQMQAILAKLPPHIFCGDMNTPRGKEIFDSLVKRYNDNIPQNVKTTVDGSLHKSGKDIQLVVDGLFSNLEYKVSNVRVVPGISDHMAIVGEVNLV